MSDAGQKATAHRKKPAPYHQLLLDERQLGGLLSDELNEIMSGLWRKAMEAKREGRIR